LQFPERVYFSRVFDNSAAEAGGEAAECKIQNAKCKIVVSLRDGLNNSPCGGGADMQR